MRQPKKAKPSPKRKMSEMILEMGAGFVGVGDTAGPAHQNCLENRLFSQGIALIACVF